MRGTSSGLHPRGRTRHDSETGHDGGASNSLSRNVSFVPAAEVAVTGVVYYKASRYRPAALFGSVTQGCLEICVAMAPLLRHTLIAILGKEGRWLVTFKYAAALLVVEENHPQRCVESSGAARSDKGQSRRSVASDHFCLPSEKRRYNGHSDPHASCQEET